MYKYLLPLLLLLTGTALAQPRRDRPRHPQTRTYGYPAETKNIVKLNVLSAFALTASGFYERALTPRFSAQVGAFQGGIRYRDNRVRGWGVTPEVRYYLLPDRPLLTGLYVGPFLRHQRFRLTTGDVTLSGEAARAYKVSRGEPNPNGDAVTFAPSARLRTWGGGMVLGYQARVEPLVLDLFVGPSYAGTDLRLESGRGEDFNYDFLGGVGVRFGLALGYAF
ncbi:MAG: hypothetical protein WBA12_15265 [Catalinimonas sp.]